MEKKDRRQKIRGEKKPEKERTGEESVEKQAILSGWKTSRIQRRIFMESHSISFVFLRDILWTKARVNKLRAILRPRDWSPCASIWRGKINGGSICFAEDRPLRDWILHRVAEVLNVACHTKWLWCGTMSDGRFLCSRWRRFPKLYGWWDRTLS